jgi:hypothetical protein
VEQVEALVDGTGGGRTPLDFFHSIYATLFLIIASCTHKLLIIRRAGTN